MTSQMKKESAQSSPSQIIATFNNFFASIPANKSFDMSYKAYIQDLADVEDRTPLGARFSATNIAPVSIASYGNQALLQSNSDVRDKSSSSSRVPSATSSLTDVSTKQSEVNWEATLSQADRIYQDNKARKDRSMVNLAEFNKALGLPCVPPPASNSCSDTIYENLSSKEDAVTAAAATATTARKAPPSFTETMHEFGKVIKSKTSADAPELFFKISDCFD